MSVTDVGVINVRANRQGLFVQLLRGTVFAALADDLWILKNKISNFSQSSAINYVVTYLRGATVSYVRDLSELDNVSILRDSKLPIR